MPQVVHSAPSFRCSPYIENWSHGCRFPVCQPPPQMESITRPLFPLLRLVTHSVQSIPRIAAQNVAAQNELPSRYRCR
jgi:hypothetical protein